MPPGNWDATGWRPWCRPRMHWRGICASVSLGTHAPPEEPRDVASEREVWASLLRLLPACDLDPDKWRKMGVTFEIFNKFNHEKVHGRKEGSLMTRKGGVVHCWEKFWQCHFPFSATSVHEHVRVLLESKFASNNNLQILPSGFSQIALVKQAPGL